MKLKSAWYKPTPKRFPRTYGEKMRLAVEYILWHAEKNGDKVTAKNAQRVLSRCGYRISIYKKRWIRCSLFSCDLIQFEIPYWDYVPTCEEITA